MLRDSQDLVLSAAEHSPWPAPDAVRLGSRALEDARAHLDDALSAHESWRALKQLQAREDAGEWFDVIESDELRERLTRSLAADPAFMAWQFVDAAIACLAAGETVAATALTAREAVFDDVADLPPPVTQVVSATAEIAAPDISTNAGTSGASLAKRIPTLQARESRELSLRIETMPAPYARPALEAEPDTAEPYRALIYDEAGTRFSTEATGIGEADVQIVVRQPTTPLIETRLPPLPFADSNAEPGARLPRASRATTVKWADSDEKEAVDFRPVGSAMDEAQVSIIATGSKSETQFRAERRALGVAPDREQQMRRFLSALSGE